MNWNLMKKSQLTSQILKDIPMFDDALGNYKNIIDINNVIIEIEQSGNNEQVVDENDDGEDLVVADDCIDLVNTFDAQKDHDLGLKFLETGCGCKEKYSNKFSSGEYVQMRRD